MSDSCAPCCIRCGTPVWSSATRSGRSTSCRGSKWTIPNSCWHWWTPVRSVATRRSSRGSRRIFTPRRRTRFIVGALGRLIDERHAQFNDTLYQLEPDVKDAPGALRDLTAIRTLASLTDPALIRQGPEDPERLLDAEDFYLRVRSILHLESRRNQNLLTHALQERAADLLGYPGPLPQPRVERLMGDYFRHARVVTRALEWARRSAPMPVDVNVGRTTEGIKFIDRGKAAIQPATWLSVFQAALDGECEVANDALVCMRQHAERFNAADFFPTPAHRAAMLRFLKPRAGLYARLSEMHDCGVLGRLLPAFQAITYRVVRDFYHKYTVDEHTLLTVRNLERLSAGPGRERFASLLQGLESPELLVLALLLHDVGKWRDEDHATESVRMARQMFEIWTCRRTPRSSSSSSSRTTSACPRSRSGATRRTPKSSGTSPRWWASRIG